MGVRLEIRRVEAERMQDDDWSTFSLDTLRIDLTMHIGVRRARTGGQRVVGGSSFVIFGDIVVERSILGW